MKRSQAETALYRRKGNGEFVRKTVYDYPSGLNLRNSGSSFQAAKKLEVSDSTIYRAIRRGWMNKEDLVGMRGGDRSQFMVTTAEVEKVRNNEEFMKRRRLPKKASKPKGANVVKATIHISDPGVIQEARMKATELRIAADTWYLEDPTNPHVKLTQDTVKGMFEILDGLEQNI